MLVIESLLLQSLLLTRIFSLLKTFNRFAQMLFRIRPVKGRIFYASGLIILNSVISGLYVSAVYPEIVDKLVKLPADL